MMRLVAALLLGLLLQDGGTIEKGTSPCRSLRPSEDPALNALLEGWQSKDKTFAWELKETKRTDKYTLSWLTFPSAVQGDIPENNTVWAKFWQPRDEAKKRPAVVLLHWLGGSFDALEMIGRQLAENGIASLMMYMPHYGPRRSADKEKRQKLLNLDIRRTTANFRQAVMDVRRAGDWLAARKDVEPSRVGIVGISLGAVVGSLAAGVDDRFARSVFLIGGGDLPAILLQGSRETAAQKKALEESGITIDRLREICRDIDPCTYASRMRPEEILMINAESDEVIPRSATEKLHEAIGGPEIRWIKGGHFAILFQVGSIIKDITAHVSKRTAY